MEQKFDLTNRVDYEKAVGVLKTFGWIVSPTLMLLYKALSPEISTEKQAKAAEELIKAGKENGVKKMTIKMSHEAGINFSANIEGVPINTKIGNDGKLEITVEYK